MATNALFVHVPVDKLVIMDGPGAREWMEFRDQLDRQGTAPDSYVGCEFRLRTDASMRLFRRKLNLRAISSPDHDYTSQFTGLFCGQIVLGVYNIRARAGWFSLD